MVPRRGCRPRRDSTHRRKAELATRRCVGAKTSMLEMCSLEDLEDPGPHIGRSTPCITILCSHPHCRLHAATIFASTVVARASDTSAPDCAASSLPAHQSPMSFPSFTFAAQTGRDIALFRVSEVVNPVTGCNHRMSPPWPIGCNDTVTFHIITAWTSP